MRWTYPIISIALGLAAVGAAFAQETEAPAPRTETGPPAATPETGAQQQAQQPSIQSRTQTWRAKRLIDRDVYNAQGQEIGEIEDILIDNDGKIAGIVVSVGGFLGLGDREVAVQFKDLTITRNNDGDPAVTTSLSQQALETAPEAPKRDN